MEDDSRKMMLDDEMNRFEAEISGSPGFENLIHKNPAAPAAVDTNRPIIGSGTFLQVKQQIQRSVDEPAPPGVIAPNTEFFSPPLDGQSPYGMGNHALNQHNSLAPTNVGQNSFNPSQMNLPRSENISNSFGAPSPLPHTFGAHPSGPSEYHQPPPSFIPPQLARSAAVSNYRSHPPRRNVNIRSPILIRPPPPPPTLSKLKPVKHTISKGPTLFKAQPAVISSGPKSNTESNTAEVKYEEKSMNSSEASLYSPSPVLERKKKVKKSKISTDTQIEASSKAVTMAEKVNESIVTIKKSVSSPSQHAQPFAPPRPGGEKKERRSKKNLRYAGGQVWEDTALNEWDKDDFRLFVGDLGNDVTDDLLTRHFNHFPSFSKAKVVREKRTNKTKGYGFISFKEPQDYIRAMKEMNGKYLGSRPIKLRKSMWKERNFDVVQKKMKEKLLAGLK